MREPAKHWLIAIAVAVVGGSVLAALLGLRPRGASALDQQWLSGTADTFLAEAAKAGMASPSGYRWRASTALERGDVVASVRDLFAATTADDSFTGRSRLLDDLAVTQESLGLTKTIFDGAFFRITFLRAGRWSWWLFATAFWLVALGAFARWYWPPLQRRRFAGIVATAVLCAAVGGAGLFLGKLSPQYAVLTGPGAVSLYRSASALAQPNDSAGRLAELPAGTLVSVSDEPEAGAVRLIEPFGGWIAKDRAELVSMGD